MKTKSTVTPPIPTIPRTVLNLGIGGNSTNDIIGRMPSILANDFNLSILMVGTNDLLNSTKLNDIPTFIANVTSIITSLKTKGDVVILSVLPCIESYLYNRHSYPVDYAPEGLNALIDDANAQLAILATSENVGYVDINAIFKSNGEPNETEVSWIRNLANTADTPTGTTEDGVHPTATGYDQGFSIALNTYIRANYTNDKIMCIGDSITFGVHVYGAGSASPSSETYPGRLNYRLNL